MTDIELAAKQRKWARRLERTLLQAPEGVALYVTRGWINVLTTDDLQTLPEGDAHAESMSADDKSIYDIHFPLIFPNSETN